MKIGIRNEIIGKLNFFFLIPIRSENTSCPVLTNVQLSDALYHTLKMYQTYHALFWRLRVNVYPCIKICQNKHKFSIITKINIIQMKEQIKIQFNLNSSLFRINNNNDNI